MNVQADVGRKHYSCAFGPSMQAMFRGEPVRVLLQIFNEISLRRPNFEPEHFIDGFTNPG